LAEITMSLLARARMRDPARGYATDFVTGVMARILPALDRQRVKVVSNAGGVNPAACAAAIEALIAEAGANLRVAVVSGDDLSDRADDLRAAGVAELSSGAPLPGDVASINAYLGATPIARALDAGADIVITGRCVDSALTLGPLIHEFGWAVDDFDRLSAGSLAGHLIECGAQVTGGNFTDWEAVPDWHNMGFPIAECRADGSFTITKPEDTGGLVSVATVAEQLLYEIGDPGAYLLPDVTCDWTGVVLKQDGANRVRVSGAAGRPPPARYKACATYPDGWRAVTAFMVGGIDAAAKGRRTAEAILKRTRRLFVDRNLADYREASVEILGAEATYGPHARVAAPREVMVKIGVRHDSREALEIFAREIAPAALSMAPGITGFYAGRPSVQPAVRLFSFLIGKDQAPADVTIDGETIAVPIAALPEPAPAPVHQPPLPARTADDMAEVPLIALARARSGDKGNSANIGVIARDPEYLPWIAAALTGEAIAGWFAHLAAGPITRFYLPGIAALNFLIENALGGGGIASVRIDPQGKAFAQMLLDMPVPVPGALAARLPSPAGAVRSTAA
ncbi:MAG: acyclic terpene utilization AtuA family protein, partial [Bauldia litoralis]